MECLTAHSENVGYLVYEPLSIVLIPAMPVIERQASSENFIPFEAL
jgi:hypothetical protein